jgi:hypothetical protein
MIKTTDQALPPQATLAYRVYPDGRREIVRGVQLKEVAIKAWKQVLGLSSEITTYNFLNPTESALQLRLTGGTDDGFVPSGGIESGIITPDLLINDMDVNGTTAGEHPVPVVPKPIVK